MPVPNTTQRDQSNPFGVFGIYDADGTLPGELSYLLTKVLGQGACALCDITHGWNPMGKREWREGTGPANKLLWIHRDEMPDNLLKVVSGKLPCIVSVEGELSTIIITREQLTACEGDFQQFEELLERSFGGAI